MEKIVIEENTGGDIPRVAKVMLGTALVRIVSEAMKDPVNRASFEAWYLERYGKPYEWKK